MLELGKTSAEQHKKVGEKCSTLNIDGVFTIGEKSNYTNSALKNRIIHKHFNSQKIMIKNLKKFIQPGDKILFKGSRGMKMENIIKGIFLR